MWRWWTLRKLKKKLLKEIEPSKPGFQGYVDYENLKNSMEILSSYLLDIGVDIPTMTINCQLKPYATNSGLNCSKLLDMTLTANLGLYAKIELRLIHRESYCQVEGKLFDRGMVLMEFANGTLQDSMSKLEQSARRMSKKDEGDV